MDIVSIANRFLNVSDNLITVNFEVDGKSYKAIVPDDQLFISIKDILLNREYEYLPEFELKRFKGKRIVDAGAHVGLFSLVASTFAKEVIAIEPHPINFKLLELNLLLNGIKNVIPINKALWFKRGKLKLYEGEHAGAHTILGDSKKYINVNSTTLDDIVDEFGKIDLLKIDVEGAEFGIFQRLNDDTLKNIKNIVGEIHLRHGNINKLNKILEDKGYTIDKFNPPLIKGKASYQIKIKDLLALKVFRRFVYILASVGTIKDNSLVILFARCGK